jgi:Putative peptidoglycan binding domain
MKTHKVLLLALIVSAVLAISVQAGNHQDGDGSSHVAPSRGRASAPTLSSGSGFHYSGGRMIAPSQRFSPMGVRSMPTAGQRRFTPGTLNRGSNLARFDSNRGGRAGSISGAGAGNHVFARHSADWHRDWDRHSDHFWHGHRCRFVNGSWFIFDLGFFPWYGWDYPYDYYYPYGYGPYGYDPGVYDQGVDPNYYGQGNYDQGVDPNYHGQGNYNSSDRGADENVAAAQDRLARAGYYRGKIDGVFGPATRRAVLRYQSDHGLGATGYLTMETRQSLGLRQVARD